MKKSQPSLILDDTAVIAALTALPEWQRTSSYLERHLKFQNFREAFAFVTECVLISEKFDHHPSITFSYNHVTIRLTSFDVGGITTRDIRWAETAEKCALRYKSPESTTS
jgi:4a-hydroxytetrahydrobiopterin dehydratase